MKWLEDFEERVETGVAVPTTTPARRVSEALQCGYGHVANLGDMTEGRNGKLR